MHVFGILCAILLWIYGLAIIALTTSHWSHPYKTIKVKVSEIIYGLAFLLDGVLLLFVFEGLGLPARSEGLLYGLLLLAFGATLAFLWGDVLYTRARVRKHPELLDQARMRAGEVPVRDFDMYFDQLEALYEKDEASHAKDVKKDLSRKALHLVILGVVIGCHELATVAVNWGIVQSFQLTPVALRNLLYYTLAFFFVFMFTTADMVRVYRFPWLPDWALKWYGTSVEIKSEKYSYISSVPFLLSLITLVFFPFAIILSAALVSCISDSVASIVGKSWGKHKMAKFGHYPHKSWEGLVGGATTAFLGVYLAFTFYPVSGVTPWMSAVFGLIAAGCFIYADAFAKYVVDNVLNTLLPGWLIYACVLLLTGV